MKLWENKINRRKNIKMRCLLLTGILLFSVMPALAANHYDQTNLVSDLPNMAQVQDPNLVNPWGISHPPTGPWWVSDNGMGVATLYNKDGTPFPIGNPLIVTIPGVNGPATPTGNVFNGGSDFEIKPGEPARFIFVTEDGTIDGWNPAENQDAIEVVNNSPDAVYKGVTIAQKDNKNYLYVANFRGGTVDVFDKDFNKVNIDFKDDKIPTGYAPFNIKNIDGKLFVTFAKQDAAKHDDVKGNGFGFVDVFSPKGKLLMRLQHGPWDNAPWGLALAPKGFCEHDHEMLLVGNFGSGKIAMFEPDTGHFHGFLLDKKGPLAIDGLWGLEFGNGGIAGPNDTLFFAAGIQAEAHGLFGKITLRK